jgi:hypothetical protein
VSERLDLIQFSIRSDSILFRGRGVPGPTADPETAYPI